MENRLKKMITLLMTVVLMVEIINCNMGVRTVKAEGNYTYEILADGTVSITKYLGQESVVHIPETIEGKKVTVIGKGAFLLNKYITQVYCPSSLLTIDEQAFMDCSNLVFIDLNDGLKTLGADAFMLANLKSCKIPDSVTELGAGLFFANEEMTEVNIPNGIVSIPNGCFCTTGITEIHIPDSVRFIGAVAFWDCPSLKRIVTDTTSISETNFNVLSKNIEFLGAGAFKECKSLSNLVISNLDCLFCDESIDLCDNAVIYGNVQSGSELAVYKSKYNIKIMQLVPVRALSMEKSLSLNKKESKSLTLSISPSNPTVKDIVWTSSNTKVATVDKTGKVTGISNGTANITAQAVDGSGVKATCKVTVSPAVEEIKLNKSSATLNLSGTKKVNLSATVSPSDTTNKTVTWTSSNKSIVNVSSTGVVTAKAAGRAVITASCDGKKAQCTVTVKPAAVKSIKASSQTTTSITFKWSKVSGVSGYSIYRYNSSKKAYQRIKNCKSTVTTYKDSKLKAGTSYTYKIKPYKLINGNKVYGNEIKLVTATKPSATKITKYKTTYGKSKKTVKLSWEKVSGATGYRIYISTKKNTGYKCVKTLSGRKNVSYTLKKLSRNQVYYIKIQAIKKVNGTLVKSAFTSSLRVK